MSTAVGEAERRATLVSLADAIELLTARTGETARDDALLGILKLAQGVIDNQAVEIQYLRKQLFGRRSEKVSRDQMNLFVAVLETVAREAETAAATTESKPKKGQPKKKRVPLRPTRTEEIPVPESERPCPACQTPRSTLGHERSLVVEYTPPKVEVIEYLREKVVCRACEGEIALAPQPKERVIDRALPGPNMLAALVVQKTVDGLPLWRSKRIFRRSGLDIPIQTLNRWEGFAHRLLEPVIDRLGARILEADTINLDDTPIRVRDPDRERGIFAGHIWCFVGKNYDPGGDLRKTIEQVVYTFAPTWEAKYPEDFLAGSKAALQGDAYRGYERIASANEGDRIERLLAGCAMHARRPFVQAFEAGDPLAPFFVDGFRVVYRIEARAREDNLTAHERLDLRRRESLPIMTRMLERANELLPLPLAKPMKNGVTYLINQFEKLVVPFTGDGRMEIDNGSAERRLRRVASGRKAWLFAGSESGAQRFADVLSLVSTAEAAAIDPGTYVASIIQNVDTWPNSRIDDLLPHAWRDALAAFRAADAENRNPA